jgi:hypothetical protein
VEEMSFGFTAKQAREYDYWKTDVPDVPEDDVTEDEELELELKAIEDEFIRIMEKGEIYGRDR